MRNFNLEQLYFIKNELIKEGIDNISIEDVINAINYKESLITENTSATGGPSVGSAGNVSSQPSELAGSLIGPNWSSHGGTEGGYISTNWASGGSKDGTGKLEIPYNPSGTNRMFQKDTLPMGKDHGPRTGKKSRVKKLDIKALKDVFAKRQDFTDGEGEIKGKGKVLNFNNFLKNDFNTIKK